MLRLTITVAAVTTGIRIIKIPEITGSTHLLSGAWNIFFIEKVTGFSFMLYKQGVVSDTGNRKSHSTMHDEAAA